MQSTAMSCLILALFALLLASSPLPTSARRHSLRDRYFGASDAEYARRMAHLSALPSTSPQQILTSLSGTPGQVTVTWVTMADTNSSTIQWGVEGGSQEAGNGTSFHFVDLEPAHTLRVIHTAHMTGIAAGATVQYRVGDSQAAVWSEQLTFVMPTAGKEVVSMVVYGDLGLVNSQSVQQIVQEVEAGQVHIVLHDGDMAYDLNSKDGTVGDAFANLIQPIASRVPYLGVQGNHENANNASHYQNRFTAYNDLGTASGSNTNMWFSWDYVSGGATVHMTALNSEMYFVSETLAKDMRAAQYAWLDADLRKARASADWVVVYGHRPLYCSNLDTLSDCTVDARKLREGPNGKQGVEELLVQHNVDLYFAGHEHDYERMFPLYRGQMEMQGNHTYLNPQWPHYIVTGSAGCSEGLEYFDDVLIPPWSVVRSVSYGYGHLVVYNATHMYWDQLLDEGNSGRDWVWVVRNETRKGQATRVEL